jgi:hypothetical protein
MDKNLPPPHPIKTRSGRMRQTQQINTNSALISSISSNNDNECNGLSDFEFTGFTFIEGIRTYYQNKLLFKDIIINKVVTPFQIPSQSIKHCICNNKPNNKPQPQLRQLKITTDSSKYGKFENTLSLYSYLISGTLNFGPNEYFSTYEIGIDGILTKKEEQQQLLQQLCLN